MTTFEQHPFHRAFVEGHLREWLDVLADDVLLHSPMLSKTFVGKDRAAALYRVIAAQFRDVVVTTVVRGENVDAIGYTAIVDGKPVTGLDVLRWNDAGRITEVTAYLRPLSSIARFVSAVGPGVATDRHPAFGVIVRVMGAPIRLLFRAIDLLGARLTS